MLVFNYCFPYAYLCELKEIWVIESPWESEITFYFKKSILHNTNENFRALYFVF